MRIQGFTVGPFQTNCYVVVNPETHAGFAVDPGMGAAPLVRQFCAQEGAQLETVVLTHGHLDHTRDAAELAVPVYIHEADEFMLDGGKGMPEGSILLFDAPSMTLPTTIRHLADGETLNVAGVSFTIRHAPGHSPGSVLLVADELAFTGDVLFAGSVGRTDLPFSDPAAMQESLRGPVWELADELTLLPGHGPVTTMAHERATNPFLYTHTP